MIKAITEHFGAEGQWATLHQATVNFTEMGERTISTQVRIDGDHAPDFSDWWLEFKGEKFILPIRDPQAAKDNSSRNSLVDLTFYSWPIYQLKRYFFVSLAQISANVAIADQYNATVTLDLEDFVVLFNQVLEYYFGDKITMDLYQAGQGIYSTNPVTVELNKTYIWDVLIRFYELFNVRWRIEYVSGTDSYVIKVNYDAPEITDHDFEYGYSGGLLKFERQVQDDNINNVLLGRGGEKNLPYRYFKRVDENNPSWAGDPDAIPELANVYFDRLRDANFRRYVQGWRTNPNRDTSWEAVQSYDSARGATDWAYAKGHTDEKFNPTEYVKDDDSIEKYGERWGAIDDNDEIYPSIQGVEIQGLGRIDAVVGVSEIISDDISKASGNAAIETNIRGVKSRTLDILYRRSSTDEMRGDYFSVPTGQTGNLSGVISRDATLGTWIGWGGESRPTPEQFLPLVRITDWLIKVYNAETDALVASGKGTIGGLPAGDYYYTVYAEIENGSQWNLKVTYEVGSMRLVTSYEDANAWKPTFDIWVKNIWMTTKETGETDEQYATRVWEPILGDRVGNEAKVVFSDGFMAASEDYEFVIASYPVYDTSRAGSEWRITLYKSDAEFDATGLFVPNAQTGGKPAAGDHFYFIGIDMPHQYVLWGEEELTAFKITELEKIRDINPTWVVSLDKVRVHTIEQGDQNIALADRLAAGATVNIKDPRFTRGEALSLFVQSITYTWNEPSEGSPYLVPDIEVVLSDKVGDVQSPVTRLNSEVSVIRSTYAKTSDIEGVVRRVASPMFLRKTGEQDVSESPTAFASKVYSTDFEQGDNTGEGWGIYKDGDGASVLELDKVIVRQNLQVNSLVANQVAYVGGKQIISAAAMECIQVVETEDSYICYFDQKKGSVANLFKIDDVAMGQSFDSENNETRYYKCWVKNIDVDSITLDKEEKDGEGVPQAGDTIVQFGNYDDADRQFAIVRDVIGGGYEQMLSGLDGVYSTGQEYYFAGLNTRAEYEFVGLLDSDGKALRDSNGNYLGHSEPIAKHRWFVGDKTDEYAEWVDGALTVRGRIIVRGTGGTYTDMAGVVDTVSYLESALPKDDGAAVTTITGGVVLSTIIGVQDSGDLVAGINASSLGADNTHGKLMLFAGSSDAQSVASATYRVYEDGHVVAGDIVATGGSIGGFNIDSNHIGTQDSNLYTGLGLYNDFIKFNTGSFGIYDGHTYAKLAAPGMSGIGNIPLLSLVSSGQLDPDTGTPEYSSSTGISIDVMNYALDNHAIDIEHGIVAGLRPKAQTVSGTVTLSNKVFTAYVTADSDITLPASPEEGQTLFLIVKDEYSITIRGNGKNIRRLDRTTAPAQTQTHTSFKGYDLMVYVNAEWVMIPIDA